MRRLRLQLFPTHPDQAAGLGFIGEAQRFYAVIVFAYSATACGVLANEILYAHTKLASLAPAFVIYVIVVIIIVLGPLLMFTPVLAHIKHSGLHRYGALSTAYTGQFQNKWIGGDHPQEEPLLGTADIQSLADLGNSYELVERMNLIPIDKKAPIHLIVASILPMAPLLLTVMSAKELFKLLAKVLF